MCYGRRSIRGGGHPETFETSAIFHRFDRCITMRYEQQNQSKSTVQHAARRTLLKLNWKSRNGPRLDPLFVLGSKPLILHHRRRLRWIRTLELERPTTADLHAHNTAVWPVLFVTPRQIETPVADAGTTLLRLRKPSHAYQGSSATVSGAPARLPESINHTPHPTPTLVERVS